LAALTEFLSYILGVVDVELQERISARLTPIESELWDDWHVVAERQQVLRLGCHHTRLFGIPIRVEADRLSGRVQAFSDGRKLEFVQARYGCIWVCLGTPARDLLTLPECDDSDRYVVNGGSVGVAASGLRAVENFLDLAHLAFVHAGILGDEPHAEMRKYKVEARKAGGFTATGCVVYQPSASPVAKQGADVVYAYTALRPYAVMLHKANPIEPHRNDMIALFVQPSAEDACVTYLLMAYLKHGLDEAALRRFAHLIFGQDKPILENQLPKRLPLGSPSEMSVEADAASAAYRRWLRASGVRYGAVSAS
jgi:phenylpropionate dioxygenase-like ring-hydroxylating dioxygenase large terminal subunit